MKLGARKGFTLIELVMVIVIIGILAAVAIPRFVDLTNNARTAAEQGVVGGVRGGIYTYFAEHNGVYPLTLGGSGACTVGSPCFLNVLSQGGVTADWSVAGLVYTGPTGATYTYTPATGEFR